MRIPVTAPVFEFKNPEPDTLNWADATTEVACIPVHVMHLYFVVPDGLCKNICNIESKERSEALALADIAENKPCEILIHYRLYLRQKHDKIQRGELNYASQQAYNYEFNKLPKSNDSRALLLCGFINVF